MQQNITDKPKQTAVSKNKTNKFSAEPNSFFEHCVLFSSRCHTSTFFLAIFALAADMRRISIYACKTSHFLEPYTPTGVYVYVCLCICVCVLALLQHILPAWLFSRWVCVYVWCSQIVIKVLIVLQQNFYLIFCRLSLWKGLYAHLHYCTLMNISHSHVLYFGERNALQYAMYTISIF